MILVEFLQQLCKHLNAFVKLLLIGRVCFLVLLDEIVWRREILVLLFIDDDVWGFLKRHLAPFVDLSQRAPPGLDPWPPEDALRA